jgi:hypothetical protein
LVYLIDLVHLVSFVQPKNQTNQKDQTNLIDLRCSYVIPARKEQPSPRISGIIPALAFCSGTQNNDLDAAPPVRRSEPIQSET